VVVMVVHRLVAGLYLAPVPIGFPFTSEPPQTMNSLPDQTTVAPSRGVGALVLVIVLHTPVTVL